MPGVPPNAIESLKKFGRSFFGRKKNKKVTEEPTAVAGESSTEAAPPAPEVAPVAAAPAVETELAAPAPAPAPAPSVDVHKQEEPTAVVKAPEASLAQKEPPVLAAPTAETSAPHAEASRGIPPALTEIKADESKRLEETSAPVEAAK